MNSSCFWILLGGACGMALVNEFDYGLVLVLLIGPGIVFAMD